MGITPKTSATITGIILNDLQYRHEILNSFAHYAENHALTPETLSHKLVKPFTRVIKRLPHILIKCVHLYIWTFHTDK